MLEQAPLELVVVVLGLVHLTHLRIGGTWG